MMQDHFGWVHPNANIKHGAVGRGFGQGHGLSAFLFLQTGRDTFFFQTPENGVDHLLGYRRRHINEDRWFFIKSRRIINHLTAIPLPLCLRQNQAGGNRVAGPLQTSDVGPPGYHTVFQQRI